MSRRRGKRTYVVYLAWDSSIQDPQEHLGRLSGVPRSRSSKLAKGAGVFFGAIHQGGQYDLVDDPFCSDQDAHVGTGKGFLRLQRIKRFGRDMLQAIPAGRPPKGCVLSGRTGLFVWGGSDFINEVSPRRIPLRYWVKQH